MPRKGYVTKTEKTVESLTEQERIDYAYEIEHNEPLPCSTGKKNLYFTNIKPYLNQIQKALESGTPVKDVCEGLGISQSCFYTNLAIYSQFSSIYNASRHVQIKNVEGALFKSAQGHKITIRKPIRTKDGFEYAEEEVYVPPNPQAQQFLLKNLMSKVYKDKVEVEQTIKVDVHHINASSTEDLLDMLGASGKDILEADFVQVDEDERSSGRQG